MARTASSASPTTASVSLDTLRPTITFMHGDGSFAEASARAVRIVKVGPNKGQLGVERRRKIMPILVTGQRAATCNLGAKPLVDGYGEAQEVAPVATLADLGVSRPAKSATPTKGPTGGRAKAPTKAKGEAQITPEDAVAVLAASLVGQSQEAVQAAFMSIVELMGTATPSPKAVAKRK